MEIIEKMLGWISRSGASLQTVPPATKRTDPPEDRPFAQPQAPISIDGYEVIRKIGRGASSSVYLAKPHLPLESELGTGSAAEFVAIKVPHGTANEPLVQVRFRREAEVAGRLTSPYAIRILARGTNPHLPPYNVMEYVDGYDLASVGRLHGQLTDGRVLAIMIKLCSVVGELHRLGMTHRDIKPSNIMVLRSNCTGNSMAESIKLLDFGLASDVNRDFETSATTFASGTPHYAAPETWQSPCSPDHRSDIYSLGCCAYHLLAGRTPHAGNNPLEICSKHVREIPVHLAQVNLPIAQPLAQLIMDCLAKAPAARPQSANELAAALGEVTPCQVWSKSNTDDWWAKYRDNRFIRD